MKTKILSCNFNETTKETDITIATKYGVFSATSKPAEEDKPYCSKLFGGDVAHDKALIKALKSHRNELQNKLDGVQHIYNMFEDSNLKTPKMVYSYRNRLEEEVCNLCDEISARELAIDKSVEQHIEATKRIRAKAKK